MTDIFLGQEHFDASLALHVISFLGKDAVETHEFRRVEPLLEDQTDDTVFEKCPGETLKNEVLRVESG